MDNKKFEQLIDLIINENEEQARALFHDIVVEKSREIYESMMDEEMVDSPVEGLMDEISAEEQGMTEEEDEFADIETDDGDDSEGEYDLDAEDMEDEMDGEEGLEDRVVDLEDKLDELMAEFESMMGQDDSASDMDDNEFGDDDNMMEAEESDDEDNVKESDDEDNSENKIDESVQLQKVAPAKMGDNGVNTKSPTLGSNNKVSGNGAKPINFSQGGDSTKGGTQGGLLNPATKDIPGNYKNAPGAKFSEKGEAAPKPKHGDDGQNTKSITSESRKMVKKPLSSVTKNVKK
jgi:hypothetical protein